MDMKLKIKNNPVIMKLNGLVPNDSLSAKVVRVALVCFALTVPVYVYENNFSDTQTTLQTECSAIPALSLSDQERLKSALKVPPRDKSAVSVCTLLPVANTEINTTAITLGQQITRFPLAFFGALFYFFATNIVVFASLAVMYWIVVDEKYPILGRTYLRQYFSVAVIFLITSAIMLPTVASVQLLSLRNNGVKYEHLAVDNRLLCSSDHVFKQMAARNAIPIVHYGYRIAHLSNNKNAIVCFGHQFGDMPSAIAKHNTSNTAFAFILKLLSNIFIFALVPFVLVLFLNIFKRILIRIINR